MFGIDRTGLEKTQRKTTFVGRNNTEIKNLESFKWNSSIHDEHVDFNLILNEIIVWINSYYDEIRLNFKKFQNEKFPYVSFLGHQ